MKVKIKRINRCAVVPKVITKGDWIDLYVPLRDDEVINIEGPQAVRFATDKDANGKKHWGQQIVFKTVTIGMGWAMQLPKGYEAVINPRSSCFSNYGLMLVNSQGVIDNTYCGNHDEWKGKFLATRYEKISKVETKDGLVSPRLLQFKIQLSQKATFWQRIKDIFRSGKIEFIEVDKLDNIDRKGFGEGTGK